MDGWKIDSGEGNEEDDDLEYTHHMTDREKKKKKRRGVFTDWKEGSK